MSRASLAPTPPSHIARHHAPAPLRSLPSRPRRPRSGRRTALWLDLALLVGLTIFAIALPPLLGDPAFQHYEAVLQAPGWAHPFGTDLLGRDILSRTAQGARISIIAAFGSQALALAIGTLIGGLAAQSGGRLDGLLMRLTDAVFAFPALLLIVLLQSVVLGGLLTLTLAMGLITWPLYARLVRGQLLTTLDAEYVIAGRALGAHPARILWTHLLPNARPALLVAWVFAIPQAVFLEASLGFLGLGVRAPTASWDGLINDGYAVVLVHPSAVLVPVVAVALLTLSATLIGEGLRTTPGSAAGSGYSAERDS